MTETILIEPQLLRRQNPAVEQYASLLIRLHEQMRNGNEEEAEEIREQMDTPGLLLDEDETQFVKGLSADLYMLASEELLRPGGYTTSDYMAAFTDAWQHRDYLAVLDLLRKKERPFTDNQVAVYRASLYERLGLQNASRQFLSFAAGLAPQFHSAIKSPIQPPEVIWDEHSIANSSKQSDVGLTKYPATGSVIVSYMHRVEPGKLFLAGLLSVGFFALGIYLFAFKSEAMETKESLLTKVLPPLVAAVFGYVFGKYGNKPDKE